MKSYQILTICFAVLLGFFGYDLVRAQAPATEPSAITDPVGGPDLPDLPHTPPNVMVVIGETNGQAYANFFALDAEGIPNADGFLVPITRMQIEITPELSGRLTSIELKIDQLIAPSTSGQAVININTASYDELQAIDGIGKVKAGAIIAERGQMGIFTSWVDLRQRVSGVGPATIADIQASGMAVIEPAGDEIPLQ